MDVEVVTIGTELLLGFTLDGNAAELGQRLADVGVRVTRRTTVGDDPALIRDAVRDALARTGRVLTTGGLGPTRDDVSKGVVAELYGWPLRFDQGVWDALVERFRLMGRDLPATNRQQAEVPTGATILPNRWGTAPGLWFEGPPGLVIMLPGVPREMAKLLRHEVVPRLVGQVEGTVVRSRVLRTTSLPESAVAERVGPLEDGLEPLTLAYLPGLAGVDLRLTAWNLPPAEADSRLNGGVDRLREALGPHAYGEEDDDLAAVLLQALKARGWRLALGESCTGGLVGARLTAVAGSSDVFAGGIVAYANSAKTELLGVDSARLAAHGAVSIEVAVALAEGAAERFHAQAGVGITGIAGPSGGTDEKPVGMVCFGWVAGERKEHARVIFPGSRHEVRERAAQLALYRLWRLVA